MGFLAVVLLPALVFCTATASPITYNINLSNYDGVHLIRVFSKFDGSVNRFIDKLVKDNEVSIIRSSLESTDILVEPGNVKWIKRDFENKSIRYKIIIEDVGAAIRKEAGIAPQPQRPNVKWDWWSSSWAQWWSNFGWKEQNPKMMEFSEQDGHATYRHSDFITWDCYYDFDDFNKYYNYLREVYGSIVTILLAGYSYEGRPISIIKISSGEPNATKVWIDGGTQGNEWISSSAVTFVLKELIENRQAHGINMKKIDFYIAPFINPDGYVYSRQSDRFWAKNRKKFEDDQCFGVNLNHNWNSHWGEEKVYRENICSWKYPGPFPFSEPETRAVSEFLVRHAKNLKVFISFQAYGHTMEYPFGYTDEEPKDVGRLKEAAELANGAVERAGSPKYKISSMFENDGYSTGNMIDWVKGELGIKYVYNVQLRNDDQQWFITRPENILPTSIDALQIVKSIVGYATK
ncbi:hypothetical protein LSTR_LSTR011885 [Laodelphax striatellus]|uniref:Peptidase M14 domain-containing protein n=1 Tax=Laodelphax striatellus TaxID=195883 RepID=A0A482XR18_LAOST|nr:hypothetical protein LSTR_LSTR011885 [Laodelphax striatellus]